MLAGRREGTGWVARHSRDVEVMWLSGASGHRGRQIVLRCARRKVPRGMDRVLAARFAGDRADRLLARALAGT